MSARHDVVVRAAHLSKTFQIREKPITSIRQAVLNFSRLSSARHEVKALDDLNFEVHRGEILGIIGRNGSGKSTLLNIILGSMRADKGSELSTRGKIVRLSLGLGFDPNLSARHNIYVNGSILGLTFKRIGQVFHEIIDFADLNDFVDTPIKYYSTGMRMRLAFAVSIYAEADIFLMDEVLASVGDESFRERSERVFKDTFLNGRTIIFVSHSLASIVNLSHKVLLLDRGKQLMYGNPSEVVGEYQRLVKEGS